MKLNGLKNFNVGKKQCFTMKIFWLDNVFKTIFTIVSVNFK